MLSLFDPNSLIGTATIIAGVLVVLLFLRSGLGEKMIGAFGSLASVRQEIVAERDQEIAKLKFELKVTTQELRQAREFADEDRRLIRSLRSRCTRYVIEINQHRIAKNVAPILAGSENEDDI